MLAFTNYKKGSVNSLLSSQTIARGVGEALGLVNDLYLLRDKRENGEKLDSSPNFEITPFSFPVSELKTNPEFQNRGDDYSEISVERILHAVNSGAFNWAAFDPITIWQDKRDGKYYILSGHSRTEAFKRLAKSGRKVDGMPFDRIPAKVFRGTFSEAKHFAQNSNTLATKETNTERAKYYHKLLELSEGKKSTISKIKEEARQSEGKEFGTIWALSFLDPRGIAFTTLADMEKAVPAPETKLLKESRADERDNKKKNDGKKESEGKVINKEDYFLKEFEKQNPDFKIVKTGDVIQDVVYKNATVSSRYWLCFVPTKGYMFYDKQLFSAPTKKDFLKYIKGGTFQYGIKQPELFSYSYSVSVNPDNVVLNGLGEVENSINAEILAVWTGKLRAAFPQLTNDHENEIYLYLAREAYPKKYKVYSDFKKVVEGLIAAHTDSDKNFNATKKLNLARASEELDNEKKYQLELNELDKEIKVSESKYSKLLQEIVKRKAGQKNFNLDEALQFLREAISAVIYDRRKKIDFEKNHGLYQQADRDQQSLFAMDGLPESTVKTLCGVDVSDTKAPAAIFNCSENELTCRGLKPTYKKLADYSPLIDQAENVKVYKGEGFYNATLDELKNAVKNWRQVERLAAHLKGENLVQSAFNIWHWEHLNLRYNYDTAGKEEIRIPARTWADRASGVDCDCLAVFTYCLLFAMGYAPKFEIVAFKNSEKYSHIYINVNGLAVDRVLPVFGQRPLGITKTKLMEVPVYELRGCKGMEGLAGLQGLYASTLKKIKNGTATKKDKLNYKKADIMIKLSGVDPNGYRLAGLVMPYVTAIDQQGAYYFDNPEIARIAKEGENSILEAERRGASDAELNGIFKKIGNAIKKTAKAVAKVAAAPVKAAVKATTTAVKATTNAVKATANVVKAGVQAATGNTTAAKETLKKAGTQAKAATVTAVKDTVKNTVVEPTKTVAKSTATIVKETIINPTVSTIKVAGKVFKVIFIKINPVTVLMRNSLRALVAINFLGMATRLNVANMTKEAAIAAGYTEDQWNSAVKAKKHVVNFFTKMGGKKELIEKTITKGATRKALFKKDYNANTQVNITDDDATLSGAGIAACLTAVGGFFAKIWGWIKKIVPKIVNTVKKVANNDTVKNLANSITQSGGSSDESTEVTTTSDTSTSSTTSSESKNYLPLIIAAVAAGGLLFMSKKK